MSILKPRLSDAVSQEISEIDISAFNIGECLFQTPRLSQISAYTISHELKIDESWVSNMNLLFVPMREVPDYQLSIEKLFLDKVHGNDGFIWYHTGVINWHQQIAGLQAIGDLIHRGGMICVDYSDIRRVLLKIGSPMINAYRTQNMNQIKFSSDITRSLSATSACMAIVHGGYSLEYQHVSNLDALLTKILPEDADLLVGVVNDAGKEELVTLTIFSNQLY